MVSRLIRSDCNESRLRSFLDDSLPEPERCRLADHLDRCEECRRTLDRLAAGSRLCLELRELAPEFGPASPRRPLPTETLRAGPNGPRKADDISRLDFL